MKRYHHLIFILLTAYICCGLTLSAQIDLFEPGTNDVAVNKNLKLMGNAKLTAGTGAGQDRIGSGYIRLTDDVKSQVGGIIIDEAFPSNMGVVVEFEYLSWTKGQNLPADGTAVFLFNAAYNSQNFKLGAVGSGLGYGGPNGSDGATGGYLGLGLDEYGNWGKGYSAYDGGIVSSTSTRIHSNISVRGSSPSTPFIKGSKTVDLGFSLAVRGYQNRPSQSAYFHKFRIALLYNASRNRYNVSVYRQGSVNGAWRMIINSTELSAAPPQNLKVGISASTGSFYGYHEIRNLRISTPGEVAVSSLTPQNVIGGTNTSYTVTVNNDSPSMLNGVSFTHLLPPGFVPSGPPVFKGSNTGDALVSGSYSQNGRYEAQLNIANNSKATLTFSGYFNNKQRTTVTATAFAKAPPKYTDTDINNDTTRLNFTLLSPFAAFGDAPSSYGEARHQVDNNLHLGTWDSAKVQQFAMPSALANTAANDDAATIVHSGDRTQMNQTLSPDFYWDSNRRLIASVDVKNSAGSAKLFGWIDFNGNGRFEASEAANVNVTSSGKYTLTFNNIDSQLRNGNTYMRLRLSTDPAITQSNPDGNLLDGDVEDYLLQLRPLDVNISASHTKAKFGENIDYGLEVINNCPFALTLTEVRDTLSPYLTYVSGSASPAVTSDSPLNINTSPLRRQLLKWPSRAVASNGRNTYTFKATISQAPQIYGDLLIYNRASALINGGNTLSNNVVSTSVIALEAIADLAVTTTGLPVQINLLSNDLLPGCTNTSVTVISRNPKAGYVSIDQQNEASYKPDLRHFGIDSFTYVLNGCLPNVDADSTQAYVLTLKPDALRYLTCPGASVTIGMAAIPEVSYHWYDSQTGGNIVSGGNGSNSITLNKVSRSQSWWVESRWRGRVFPRYQVVLDIDNSCGDASPTGCALTGSLIWKEDFDLYDDGLNPASNVFSSEGLAPGMTTYNFAQTDANIAGASVRNEGYYAIIKHGQNIWVADNFKDDHTSPTNSNIGRFFIANGKSAVDKVYEQAISNLCPGTTLYLSFWMRGSDAIIRWNIHSAFDGSTLASFLVPELPSGTPGDWLQYGFRFTVPDNIDSVYFDLYNYSTKSSGNDFAIDDIEVRLCVSPVIAFVNGLQETSVCYNDTLRFTVAPYTDDGVLITSALDMLKGYWIRSSTGDINNDSDWSIISGSEVNGSAGGRVLNVPELQIISSADSTLYYRFVVEKANSGALQNMSCRAVSDILSVHGYVHITNYPDIRLQLCPTPARPLKLSSYLDTVYLKTLAWSTISRGSPLFVGNSATTTGEVLTNNFNLGTHIYQYKVENVCTIDSGRVYIKVLSKATVGFLPDTLIVCRSIQSSAHLQLNQILGLEANGNWEIPVDLQAFVTSPPPQSYFNGAFIFDAQSAWQSLNTDQSYNFNYKGDGNSAAFKFTYNTGAYANPPSQSCVGDIQHELVIIVTSKML
ncbi:MAG: DUF11 domain-containing protein [Prevotellaceae bacterium]|jgi:uncharacterized repeat protein (TIGR01451 family)|nr:DUF11 domain-containing protein [Prevotellaceae bacterium]